MNCCALRLADLCEVQWRRARRRAIRHGFGIQVRSLGPQIADLEEKRSAQVLLHADVPTLRITDFVILLHGIVVRGRSVGRTRWRSPFWIVSTLAVLVVRVCSVAAKGGCSDKFGGQPIERGGIVVNAVAQPHHGGMLRARFPCQPATRRPVVAIRLDQAVRKCARVRPGCPAQHRRCTAVKPGRDVEIRDVPVFLRQRRIIFVAQAKHQRQVRIHAPIVVGINVPRILAEIRAVCRRIEPTLDCGTPSRKSAKSNPVLGTGWPFEIESAGGDAAELERAARVLIGECVAILALEIASESQCVIFLYPTVGIALRQALHRRSRRKRVGEAGKVGEGEGGRAIVDRLLRRPLDAGFRPPRSVRTKNRNPAWCDCG